MMLDRICPEVVEMLKDKTLTRSTFDVLRKMKPMRQIDVAEVMLTANNFSHGYSKALLAATRQAAEKQTREGRNDGAGPSGNK
jgi:hypothetical protein